MTTPNLDRLSPTDSLVLKILTQAAERGEICPTNPDLASTLICASIATPSQSLTRLEERGLIVVRRFQTSRQVKIVSTGKWTKKPKDDRPHWRQKKSASRLNTLRELRDKVTDHGLSIRQAADHVGISHIYANQLWRQIRQEVGCQAV